MRETDTNKRCGTCRYIHSPFSDHTDYDGVVLVWSCHYRHHMVPDDYWCWRWLAPKRSTSEPAYDSVIGHEW